MASARQDDARIEELESRIKELEAELAAAVAGGKRGAGRLVGSKRLRTDSREKGTAVSAAATDEADQDAMERAWIVAMSRRVTASVQAMAGRKKPAAAAASRICVYISRDEDMPSGHRVNLDGPEGNPFRIMGRVLRLYPDKKDIMEGMIGETYEQVVRVASAMLPKTTFYTRDRGLAGRINCVNVE